MRRTTLSSVRLASLTAATFVLVLGLPLLLMYVGGLLAGLPVGRESERIGSSAPWSGALLAACRLAGPRRGPGAHLRRGLAVAAMIVVLLVSSSWCRPSAGTRGHPATRRWPGRRDVLALHPRE